MAYTLISSLGGGGYDKTTYLFCDEGKEEKKVSQDLFLRAIVESNYYDLTQVIVIGTDTSDWSFLAKEVFAEDFLLDLQFEIKNGGISKKNLDLIKNQLSQKYNIPFYLLTHTDKIENRNIEHIFKTYMDAISNVEDTDILLDITHSFRSMPIFMYQSLLYKFSHIANRRIEIIYGEFKKGTDISPVRNLSEYWEFAQRTEAKTLFFKKLDGRLLAEKLENINWDKGKKCINAFSGIVESNYALQVKDVINRIEKILEDEENRPEWVEDIKYFLKKFKDEVSDNSFALTLYKYAVFLSNKKLFTQAIIALQIAVEVKIITAYDGENSSAIGDYDLWNPKNEKKGKGFKDKYIVLREEFYKDKNKERKNKKNIYNEKLFILEFLRNQIAHGGAKSKFKKNTPSAANTKSSFESLKEDVLEFFEFVDNTMLTHKK